MLTYIMMDRNYLITKEEMENYCMEEDLETESVNDDLDSLFENLCLGKKTNVIGYRLGYFFPKLTKEELKLIAKKDKSYLGTFLHGMQADVDEAEMKLSESNRKFVYGEFQRETFEINIKLGQQIQYCKMLTDADVIRLLRDFSK